ncbi:MAG: peroxidase family protein [Phycisphaerales bacterium JB037]
METREMSQDSAMGVSMRVARGLVSAAAVALLAGAAAGDDRTITGWGNNLLDDTRGMAGTNLIRMAMGARYDDGVGQMMDGPNPRAVSNAIAVQGGKTGNHRALSSMHWQWGQFIDHDFTLIEEGGEFAPIAVPMGDPQFDPFGTGTQMIPFHRSKYGAGVDSARTHANELSTWIDGSNVYGSDEVRAAALRTGVGGRLATSAGDMMPYNTGGLPNAGGTGPTLFLAGDVRANEQAGLTTMHTVFVREHNYWADRIAGDNPGWSDEQVYQRARKIVGAEIQAITYNEYLPALLGGAAPRASDAAYDASVDPAISETFSAAAFRLGHTMLNSELKRYNEDGTEYAGGHLSLSQAFFHPSIVTEPGSLDAIVRGLAQQQAEAIDTRVVDDVRNMLFGPPGAGGLDLLSLNIQRGRDHGLQDYNTIRAQFGLTPVGSFAEITSDAGLATMLEALYGDVDTIDPWVGLMSEDAMPGSSLGETAAAILIDQFTRLRDGDRFFYLWDDDLSEVLSEIESTRLSDILLRNTDIVSLQGNVFLVPAPGAGVLLAMGGLLATRRRR